MRGADHYPRERPEQLGWSELHIQSSLIDDATRDGRITIEGSLAGTIDIDGNNGLAGQVIVNAANASDTWTGAVTVGSSNTSLTTRPYYSNVSSTVGGGAVGLVPYLLYEPDCEPRHYDDWHWTYEHDPLNPSRWPAGEGPSSQRLLNSTFCGAPGTLPQQHATFRFYGPVYTPADEEDDTELQPYTVWQYVSVIPSHTYVWQEVTDAFVVDIARTPATARREVTISTTAPALQADYFAVVFNTVPPETEGVDRYSILCGGTTATPIPAPGENVEDNDADSRCPMAGGFCYADLDDGTGFVNCVPGYPDAGVDIDDLLYFLQGFEAGCVSVDLDDDGDPAVGIPDSGVDINDLLFFLYHFEYGC